MNSTSRGGIWMRAAIAMFAMPSLSYACAWDYDTLAMERQQFPEAHELIAGYFVRHSQHYYRWRIGDRNSKPLEAKTPADFDDVAVAYDKLGQHDDAIAEIRKKMQRWPDTGTYESEANLGTFLIHAGRYKEGLQHIRAAIAINPDAHFGREIYQQRLVEYLLSTPSAGESLPLSTEDAQQQRGFATFVLEQQGTAEHQREVELQQAVQGVLGMMRFGKYDSPVLLEALGDLLLHGDYGVEDAKMLAARAYLRAADVAEEDSIAEAYRLKAEQAMEMQYERTLDDVEADLKQELASGATFFHQIASDEATWLAAGKNLDSEFGKKYYQDVLLDPAGADQRPLSPMEQVMRTVLIQLAVVVLLLIAGVFFVRRLLRARATHSA